MLFSPFFLRKQWLSFVMKFWGKSTMSLTALISSGGVVASLIDKFMASTIEIQSLG